MSPDRSPEAERLLMRIRASADPAPGVDRQVLAKVEQRIAAGGAFGSRASDDFASRAGTTAAGGSAAGLLAQPSRWQLASRVVTTLGRWGSFGIVAGAIGYYFGATERDRASSDTVAPAAPMLATPVVAVPAEPARPGLAASDAVPEVSVPDVSLPDIVSGSGVPTASSETAAVAAPSHSFRPAKPAPRGLAVERRTHRATPAAASEGTLSLAEVLERLMRAQANLREGDPHATLAELDALDSLTHDDPGALLQERLVARALAFCDIGRVGDARRVLSELDRLGADSIYRGRLEQGCSAALVP